MQLKNLAGLIAGVIISVLLLTTVLIPVTSMGTSETLTYLNEGVPYTEIDEDTHTIVVSYDGSVYSITTDGEACMLPDLSLFGSATLVYGTDGLVRMASNGYIRGCDSSQFGGYNVSVSVTVTITVTSTTAVVSNGTQSKTFTINPTHYIASKGDYVLVKNPCVTDDTIILAGFTEFTGVGTVAICGSGTIDGVTATVPYTGFVDEDLTVTSMTNEISTTTVSTNLVRIDSIVFTISLSDDSTQTATYTYFLAPHEITYDNPTYAGDSASTILSIVPLLIVVGIILAVIAIFISRRE